MAPSLKDHAQPIGGLTTAGGFFALSRLGHDVGLTLSVHGSHRFGGDGQVIDHDINGAKIFTRQFEAVLKSGLPWIEGLQVALLDAASRTSRDQLALSAPRSIDTASQTTLHSWLLTPRG